MEIAENVRKIFQELVLPELGVIKEESRKIVTILELTNKRLDDVNTHLADQSRRIDNLRSEITERIDETNKRIDEIRSDLTTRIDETNKRIDKVRSDLTTRIDEVRSDLTTRIDEVRSDLTIRIDELRSDLTTRIDDTRSDLTKQMSDMHSDIVHRIDSNNERIDRFFMTAATKESQSVMERRLTYLETRNGRSQATCGGLMSSINVPALTEEQCCL